MQLSSRDLLIVALGIYVLTRIDWRHLNSFHALILFLLALMLMLRWANMRKNAVQKQSMNRYREQYEAEAKALPTETPAEEVSPADMTVDGEKIPTEEDSPAEEKPEE